MNKELLFIIKEIVTSFFSLQGISDGNGPYNVYLLNKTYCKTLLELTQTSSTGEDIG